MIVKADTVLVDGVECLPKFDPTKLNYEPKAQHPLYRTTNNMIGIKKPCVYDVPTNYLCVTHTNPPLSSPSAAARPRFTARAPAADVCLKLDNRPTSQAFSNTFSIGESTNKRTVMFKDNGLSTSTTRSKVHNSLDWGI